ncbi:MAG TPA: LysR family transcriptional regulator [Marmoricola sp.]|nr:LysR family transcriptional regulator [Marmoricola sp.]
MRQWPDLTALELLVAVADHGSLSSAARALGMAQPNASRSIGRLERHLGVNLVVRSTAGSRLTPEGLLIVDWARVTLEATATLLDGAEALAAGNSTLTVAASQTVGEHLLPLWLSKLRIQHPEATVTVQIENSAAVTAAVLSGHVGLGFIEDPDAPKGLHIWTVGHDELIVVISPSHPWARRRKPLTLNDLAATPLLVREPGSGTRVAAERAVGGDLQIAQVLHSNAAIRVSAQAGTAPAVLSRIAVADALASGALLEVRVDDEGARKHLRRELRAVWTGPRRLSGVAADLVTIARSASA